MTAAEALTAFQRAVLEAFFSLPESRGFVLAGGAGLLATGLSTRPTDDVDLFGSDLDVGVGPAGDAFQSHCDQRGWRVVTIQAAHTFRRLEIVDGEDVLIVDLAIDTPPVGAIHVTEVGPTFEPEELAARKLLALFDRAAARDFADVHTLSKQFDVEDLIAAAAELDGGFDLATFVTMLLSIDRFSDAELEATGATPQGLRNFATGLADRLR